MTPPSSSRAARRAASAERILTAAQVEFGERGLEAATIRGIAARAGVDPALVIQHYGSKRDLFTIAAALDRDSDDEDLVEHLADVVDARLGELAPETRALVRSMLTAPDATRAMQRFLDERVDNLARSSDDADARLRAALTVSAILGLTVAKHFLRLDALQEISEEQRRSVLRPWLADTARPRAAAADDP